MKSLNPSDLPCVYLLKNKRRILFCFLFLIIVTEKIPRSTLACLMHCWLLRSFQWNTGIVVRYLAYNCNWPSPPWDGKMQITKTFLTDLNFVYSDWRINFDNGVLKICSKLLAWLLLPTLIILKIIRHPQWVWD